MLGKRIGYGFLYNIGSVSSGKLAPGQMLLDWDDVMSTLDVMPWSPMAFYSVDEIVIHDSQYWLCVSGPTQQEPGAGADWDDVPVWTKGNIYPINKHVRFTKPGVGPWIYKSLQDFNNTPPEQAAWRVPSVSDFENLRNAVDPWATGWDLGQNNAGTALRSSVNEWNTPGTDTHGFSALPSGYMRDDAGEGPTWFASGFRSVAPFWTSTTSGDSKYVVEISGSGNAMLLFGDGGMFYNWLSVLPVRCCQAKGASEIEGDTGLLRDYTGNIYEYIVIGNLRWMKENLRAEHRNDGLSIGLSYLGSSVIVPFYTHPNLDPYLAEPPGK